MSQVLLQAFPALHSSSTSRAVPEKLVVKCSFESPVSTSNKLVTKHVLSGFAASLVFFSQLNQAVAADIAHQGNMCQLASAADSLPALLLDEASESSPATMMMMRGMTAKNFDPVRYSGRWFEVASLKRGFAGQGQEDCHCTQVICKWAYIRITKRNRRSKSTHFAFTEVPTAT